MRYPLKRLRLKIRLHRLGIVLLLLAFLLSSSNQWLISYGQWLSVSNPAAVGDVVVALGDGTGVRADAAFKLLTSQRAKLLFTTSISPDFLHFIAAKHSVSLGRVHWGGITKNTFDEALRFRETMAQAGISYHRIILVSHPYHLRRAQWTFQKVLGSSIEVETYAVSSELPSDSRWWNHFYYRRWVESETKKLVFYWMYYGLLRQRTPLSPRDLVR